MIFSGRIIIHNFIYFYCIKDPIIAWCARYSHEFNQKFITNANCYVNAFGYPKEDKHRANLNFTFEINV